MVDVRRRKQRGVLLGTGGVGRVEKIVFGVQGLHLPAHGCSGKVSGTPLTKYCSSYQHMRDDEWEYTPDIYTQNDSPVSMPVALEPFCD
jgi:hypothetical protein